MGGTILWYVVYRKRTGTSLVRTETFVRAEEKKRSRHVRKAVSYRGLFTAGWFGVREKHCFRLEIYDHLRASEQAEGGGINEFVVVWLECMNY